MIDYSTLKHGKPRPKALEREDRRRVLERRDKAESAKAKARAAGFCEVRHLEGLHGVEVWRCIRKDSHTHHLLSGIGRRNVGKSILADWKLRVCAECHRLLHAKVLQPIAADMDAAAIRFRRVR